MTQLTLGLAALTALLVAGQQAPARKPPQFITEPEALAYDAKVIRPTLNSFVNNPKELPAVREKLQRFFELTSSAAIAYSPMPFSLPSGKVAQMEWDATRQRPALMVSVPEMMMLQELRPPGAFEEGLVLFFVAEMVRYEQAGQRGRPSLADRIGKPTDPKIEAAVWGQTILEVVRPWGNRGRLPDHRLFVMSFTLQRFKDNYDDPAWVRSFSQFSRSN